MRIRHVGILHLLPVAVMLAVAGFNLFLVHGSGLSIWRVGGFGMFSSLDNRSTRYVRAVAVDGEATQTLDLSEYETTVEHLRILPRERNLEAFLQKLTCNQEFFSSSTAPVELIYYGLDFKGTKVVPVVRWRERLDACPTP